MIFLFLLIYLFIYYLFIYLSILRVDCFFIIFLCIHTSRGTLMEIRSHLWSRGILSCLVWHQFWIDETLWWDSKQNEYLRRTCRLKGSLKKMFLQISQNSQEKICTRISFLIKLNSVDLQFIKEVTLMQVFSCEFYEICKNTFFGRTPPDGCFWL